MSDKSIIELLNKATVERIAKQLQGLDKSQLLAVQRAVDFEIGYLERKYLNALLEEGWWRETYDSADDALNLDEKCQILGILHVNHNPSGKKRSLSVVKNLRNRFSNNSDCTGLVDCKKLMDAYLWEIQTWKARPPEFSKEEQSGLYSRDAI